MTYRKIVSSNMSHLEAHVGFFRLLMKGFFGPYVLYPFEKSGFFLLVMRILTRNYKVFVEKHKQKNIGEM